MARNSPSHMLEQEMHMREKEEETNGTKKREGIARRDLEEEEKKRKGEGITQR